MVGEGQKMDRSMCRRFAQTKVASVRAGECMYGSVGVW